MGRALKFLTTGAFACVICACSQNGAEAQSTPEKPEQKITNEIQANWTVDPTTSVLGFMGSQGGEEFEGKFKNFDASIKFDPEDLQNTNIVVTIDMASVDAGDAERNEALPGKEWFAVKPFPNAVFTSTSIKHTGGNSYEASGELTLKDITRPVVLPFELKIDGDTAEMAGSTLIDRTDFQVGTGMWKSEDWVAHNVKINVKITAARK